MNRVKNIAAVVSVSTPIADSDYYSFQDYEPALVFERLPLDKPRPHRVVPLDLRHSAGQHGLLDVNDVQSVLRHLFCRMGGHIVLPKPNPLSYPFDP